MEQSEERNKWLEARKHGIGGSDAACVIGKNPYKTNVELWEEKTGIKEIEDISGKDAVKYGKEAEKYLRGLFELDYPKYEVSYDEYGMIANLKKYPFIFATLDGTLEEKETGCKGILEIKTTKIHRKEQYNNWNNKVPDHYYIQLIHQLLATGYDFAVMKAQIKTEYYRNLKIESRHYFIQRKDVINDINYLLREEIKFWDCVKNKKMPDLILPQI